MKILKLALTAVGLLASLVSTWFSVELYTSFASTGLDKMVYTACGIAMQSMQLLVYVCSWFYFWRGDKGKAVIGFTCFLSLMVLSIIASLGFFSVVNKKTTTAATQNSDVYTGMKDRLASIDSEIAGLQDQVAAYAAKGYITKGVKPTQERIDQLRQERQQVLTRVDGYKLTPDADALYAYLAEFMIGKDYTREDVQRIKLWIYLMSAICLDVVSAVLLGFSLDFGKGAIGETAADDPGRSGGCVQKTLAGQSFAATQVSGGAIAKNDDAVMSGILEQNRLLQERLDALERQRTEPGHNTVADQNRALIEHLLKRFDRENFTSKDQEKLYSKVSEPESAESVDSPVEQELYSKELYSKVSEPETVKHDVIVKYVSTLFSRTKADGSLMGRNSVADVIGISYRDAAAIHSFLKTSGFITVKGNSTYPVYDRDQILAEISRGNGNSLH